MMQVWFAVMQKQYFDLHSLRRITTTMVMAMVMAMVTLHEQFEVLPVMMNGTTVQQQVTVHVNDAAVEYHTAIVVALVDVVLDIVDIADSVALAVVT
jgi:hypothetical protein